MPFELLDVIDELRLSSLRCRAADALIKANMQTTVRPLIRPNREPSRRADTIKPGPAQVIEGVVKLASDGRHDRDGIGFILEHEAKVA